MVVSALWAITFSNVVLNNPVDASWAVTRHAHNSVEQWVLRRGACALIVDKFSVLASWWSSARVEDDVPVRKCSVEAVASLVDSVPFSTNAFVDWLASSPHVVVHGIVTSANFGCSVSSAKSDGSSMAWVLADSSDKVSSILAYARVEERIPL